ncbi:hypothetical protein [Paracoccus aerius]|uniref:Uncharacterized protein n=1 Tax=Paracoccus aerius TaxID=1915382 RepID=A0ABS1S6A9_9RHOB|nr:hypothetical protein [Paracoccus aerius]MBL3674271.1 hypothetical protein [Paracoccus aerius]GHG24500.1 hypothetical protein GCM10017322_23110 [Paracoccus aerius]
MKHTPEHIAARAASKRLKAQERRDQPSNGTTWREQFNAGRCLARAAEAMGQTIWRGKRWADAAGVKWPDGRSQDEHKEAVGSARRRRFQEDDAFRERELARIATVRPSTSPVYNRRLNMTEDELARYDLVMSKRYTADEAALIIGRPDLTRRAMLARRDPQKLLADLMAADAASARPRVNAYLHSPRGAHGHRRREHQDADQHG